MKPTQAQIEAAAAAEVRPADISCPFCGGENGQHDHNCGLKKTAAAADPALRDFIADTPVSEPNDGWAVESNLVERLRGHQLDYDGCGITFGGRDLLKEAADEIERLRAALEKITKADDDHQCIYIASEALKDKP